MPAFIELTVDEFESNRRSKSLVGGSPRHGAGMDSVRRPLRGIEVKEDTHAVIRVLTASGKEIPLINSSYPDGEGPSYTNFILQSVTDERIEKSQIVETFGDDFVFFFGEKPRIAQVQSVLINSFDFNWYAEFWANYEGYLRGTKCVELGARVYLFYDDIIVSGYMMNAAAALEAGSNGRIVNLSFSLLIFSYDNVSFVGDPNYPVRVSADDFSPSIAGLIQSPNDLGSLPEWLGVQMPPSTGTLDKNDGAKPLSYSDAQSMSQMQKDGPDKEIGSATPGNPNGLSKGLDKASNPMARTKALRSKISDNVDEWTGDFTSFMSKKQVQQVLFEEAKNLQMAFLKNSCGMGLLGGSPGTMGGMGLIGPGSGLSGLKDAWAGTKDAWNSAKEGDWGAAANSLGQTGLVNIKGSASYTLGVNGSQTGGVAGFGMGQGGTGAGYMQWSSDTPYMQGGGVGYGANGYFPGGGGGAGYYPGAGYYGYGQSGAPGSGSGGMPSNYQASGAWSGYGPGSNTLESGSYSYQGSVPPPPGFANSPWGGAYPGGYGSTAKKKSLGPFTTGYAGAQYQNQNASSQYYSNATSASWDPTNGFQWGNGSSTPNPGQPGGGVFTTQAVPMYGGEANVNLNNLFNDEPVVTTKNYGADTANNDTGCGGKNGDITSGAAGDAADKQLIADKSAAEKNMV